MKHILDLKLGEKQAALWFLGQAGYVARAGGLARRSLGGGAVTLAIDPYLTDSVGKSAPSFSRRIPVPIEPEELEVDVFIVTHDHLDHLDPETIQRYRHRATTAFVAPRFAARKLADLGVPEQVITKIDVGETAQVKGIDITGVFALPTGPDALDTCGYLVRFPNGRSFYHASDTAFCELLLKAAPRPALSPSAALRANSAEGAEVLLVPINGKWGNLDVEEAMALTAAVKPRYVLPNHYDLMALNSENPETFRHFWNARRLPTECVVAEIMQPFVWGAAKRGGRAASGGCTTGAGPARARERRA
jgi:L-ascorbate 6-phosphate lactonase